MRQRLTIILTFVVIIGLLALVSSIRYVKKEKEQEIKEFVAEVKRNKGDKHL